jgi:hypothetical protein
MGPQVPMPITDFLNGFKADPGALAAVAFGVCQLPHRQRARGIGLLWMPRICAPRWNRIRNERLL